LDWLLLLALWLHTIALVIAVGYYGVLGRIIVPALTRTLHGSDLAETLAAVERHALPLVLLAVVLFAITGSYLLVVNPDYQGLGHFFDSTWATLMLVKHGVVIVLVGVGVVIDWVARGLIVARDDAELARDVRRVRLGAELATALGVLAILLTAAAQVSA
jgi:uncharacterized membrane protein